ncbi:MAG: hypothetical protein ACREXU_04640, partial [Gammaproteobacteria bacterium]
SFPRRFAAASLKLHLDPEPLGREIRFSAAIRRSLIEAQPQVLRYESCSGFPRRFAAASLKQRSDPRPIGLVIGFSAAIRRGLIEAISDAGYGSDTTRFSVAIRRGLIEAGASLLANTAPQAVFRGDSPRPH